MLQVSQGAKVIHFVIVLCNVQKDITLDNDKQEHKHNEILALGPGDLLHNITTVLLGNLVAALLAPLLHNLTAVLLGGNWWQLSCHSSSQPLGSSPGEPSGSFTCKEQRKPKFSFRPKFLFLLK